MIKIEVKDGKCNITIKGSIEERICDVLAFKQAIANISDDDLADTLEDFELAYVGSEKRSK